MPTPKPKRYYLIRTPSMRKSPLGNGFVRSNKRAAISHAKQLAQCKPWRLRTPVRNRRISVYTVDPGKRPSLLFQCHVARKTGCIVSEVL